MVVPRSVLVLGRRNNGRERSRGMCAPPLSPVPLGLRVRVWVGLTPATLWLPCLVQAGPLTLGGDCVCCQEARRTPSLGQKGMHLPPCFSSQGEPAWPEQMPTLEAALPRDRLGMEATTLVTLCLLDRAALRPTCCSTPSDMGRPSPFLGKSICASLPVTWNQKVRK